MKHTFMKYDIFGEKIVKKITVRDFAEVYNILIY